jgi:hypothetical protein
VGRDRKRRLGMGARVHVIVTSVNPIEGLVDLALVEIDEGAQRRPQKSPRKKRGRER